MATSREIDEPPRANAAREQWLWGLPMVLGILLILLGALCLYASVVTSYVSVLYLGFMLMVLGAFEIVAAFRRRHSERFFVYFLAGVLSIVVGAMFLRWPLSALSTLTLFVAGYFFASGLFRGVSAIMDRYARWGWDFAYALVAIALGVYIVASWPISALWVLGTVVSAEIIARGVTLVAASSVLHDVQHHRLAPLTT